MGIKKPTSKSKIDSNKGTTELNKNKMVRKIAMSFCPALSVNDFITAAAVEIRAVHPLIHVDVQFPDLDI